MAPFSAAAACNITYAPYVIGHVGGITAFLSAAALAATMGMNAHGGMLTVLTGVASFRPIQPTRRVRVVTIVALAIVWFATGKSISTGAVNTVFTSLTLMLYLLVPWTATNLMDFFFVRHGHYKIRDLFTPDDIYGAWAWRGLTAYFAGFLCEIPFMVLSDLGGWSYTGPLAKQVDKVDIGWIVGLIVSGGVYLWLSRSLDVEAEERAAKAEPVAELV